MTRWEQFYRWLGGIGPNETRTVPEQWELLASAVAEGLARMGFLYRPALGPYASWYVYHRWQWLFWRGRYWECEKWQDLKARYPYVGGELFTLDLRYLREYP